MTPAAFENACDDFIAIENLSATTSEEPHEVDPKTESEKDAERELWKLMHQSRQNYRDESGWAKLGEVRK